MTRYFEDFVAGESFELGTKTVTGEEIMRFGREFDPQPFHIDPEEAKHTSFGGLVASGVHTFAIFMRLFVNELIADVANIGGAGSSEMRWLLPVRPGDTLSGRATILPETRPSRTKRDRGILVIRADLSNQHAQLVWHATLASLVRRRT
jgi:acyl dehydratase